MSINEGNDVHRPRIIPSAADPDIECVPIELIAPDGHPSAPPAIDSAQPRADTPLPRLCPEGYVPRRKRQQYTLRGKLIVDPDAEPEENPRAKQAPNDP